VDPEYYVKKYNVPILGKKANPQPQQLKNFFD